eukprot:gb/GECG01014088.1/.p1 GENE.gb/GECG01014088.1/~~gb/GECG01014088.1/.p1  ORF type:complete len:416 (+),score=111.70 gb/GECG01014088.1/:1-1248(+)
MTSDDNIKLELLLEDIRHLSHQCTATSDDAYTENESRNTRENAFEGYEDLFEQQSSISFKIDGLEIEEFKKRIVSKQEEDRERIQQLERDLQKEQNKADEYEAKNLEQTNIIEELEKKLSLQSNKEDSHMLKDSSKNESNDNTDPNKAHTEVIIAYVRQQLEDLQAFVKVPEETYDTLRQEIESVRKNIDQFKRELIENEKTCEKLQPLVRKLLLLNEDLEKRYRESSNKMSFLRTQNRQLEESSESRKSQSKQQEELSQKRQQEISKLLGQRKALAQQVHEFEGLWKETKEQRDRYNEENKELREELFKRQSAAPLQAKPPKPRLRSIALQTEDTETEYVEIQSEYGADTATNQEEASGTSQCTNSSNQVATESETMESAQTQHGNFHRNSVIDESGGVFDFDYESEEDEEENI